MQSKRLSAVETIISTVVGFGLSWALLTYVISPVFNVRTSLVDNIWITVMFTVLSLVRGYAVRRFFNWWQHRDIQAHVRIARQLDNMVYEDGSKL